MSLEKWLEYGWLKREASSPNEIQGLLSIVKRSLNAKVTAISADLRFTAAFNAALAAATTALRASGYRAPTQPGHSSPPVPFDLAAGRSFEVAALHRVAIWCGGFTEAATRVD